MYFILPCVNKYIDYSRKMELESWNRSLSGNIKIKKKKKKNDINFEFNIFRVYIKYIFQASSHILTDLGKYCVFLSHVIFIHLRFDLSSV